jgi:hypothetical protein
MLGIDDPWAAYDLDLATAMTARSAEIENQEKPRRPAVSPVAGLARGKLKKVKIPASGIW